MVAKFMLTGGEPDREDDIVHKLRSRTDIGFGSNDMHDYALEHLRTAKSAAIRNAAALALSDLRASDAVQDIIDVVMRPGVAGSAGTLLYAAEELGGDLPLGAFVHVLDHGSYEARQQALDLLIAGHVVAACGDDVKELLTQVESLLRSGDDEKAAAAAEALDILRAGPDPDGPVQSSA